MIKEMLSVLMDNINDANMLMDYATKAKMSNDDTFDWFMKHAKMRVDNLWDDYKRIDAEIMLEAKAREGDPIAESLKCYVKDQITSLKTKLAGMM